MANSTFIPTPTESKDILMPDGVMNIMLGYESKVAAKVKNGSLVPTLFNAIKPRKLKDVKALLTAVVMASIGHCIKDRLDPITAVQKFFC